MADKGIDRSVNFGGFQLKNFLVWLRTTAEAVAGLLSTGAMAFDTDKDFLSVKTSGDIRDIEYAEKQVTVVTDFTVLPEHNRCLIFLDDNVTAISVEDTLPDGFYCQFYNINGNNIVFQAVDCTLNTPDGTTLVLDKYCTLFKYNTTGEYYLKGELS